MTNQSLMLEHQGKRVRVTKADGSREWALTIVRVIDTQSQELRLVNRDAKTHKPDWPLSQKLWEAVGPAEPNDLNCEYDLTIR